MLDRVSFALVFLAACDLGVSSPAGDGSVTPAPVDGGDGPDGTPPRFDAGHHAELDVTLRTFVSRQFLCAEDGGGGEVVADRATAQGWETFTLVDLDGGELLGGDAVALRTSGGRYLEADNGGLDASGQAIDAASTFRIVRRAGEGAVVSKEGVGFHNPASGGWITAANGGGGATSSDGAELGDWQTFEIDLKGILPPAPPPVEWVLVWQDEFDGPNIDESKWSFEIKPPGWVNHELQNYVKRPENARIENGRLIIEGRRDNYNGHEYSSARLHTHGKASWLYGKFEARLQVPAGRGTWPAFWMMPDDCSRGWPACGEIDVMEHVGYEPDRVHATTHSLKYNWKAEEQRTGVTTVPGATTGFHDYVIEWRPDRIDGYVDGRRYFTSLDDGTGDDAWPFTKKFYLILNLAIGGDWGGAMGVDTSIWPEQYVIEHVRVYQGP